MSEQVLPPERLLRTPGSIEELGIPRTLIEDIFMRRLASERQSMLYKLCESIGLTIAVGRAVADDLREKKIVEYFALEGRDYRIGLTEAGTKVAAESRASSQYSSYLPVPLEQYVQVVEAQKAVLMVNRENIRTAFADLVVEDSMLDALGPAFMNDGAIFLYGPPGTGKTSLAERMIKIHKDLILVPRVVEIDSSIVSVFDPAVHKAIENQPQGLDPRWVVCERPLVIVGGELSPNMIDLSLDVVSGVYSAPIQMLANNGILVVDDFGRQQITPNELMNRWIVPLAQGVDYLKLANGTKFTVPFELKLIASTNLDPNALGDDAFLRRLRNKVFVGPVTPNAFNWILARVAKAKGIEVTGESAQHLKAIAEREIGELRPYLAVDFCDLMIGVCTYEGLPRVLDKAMIDRVASVYFVNEADGAATASASAALANDKTPAAQPQAA